MTRGLWTGCGWSIKPAGVVSPEKQLHTCIAHTNHCDQTLSKNTKEPHNTLSVTSQRSFSLAWFLRPHSPSSHLSPSGGGALCAFELTLTHSLEHAHMPNHGGPFSGFPQEPLASSSTARIPLCFNDLWVSTYLFVSTPSALTPFTSFMHTFVNRSGSFANTNKCLMMIIWMPL